MEALQTAKSPEPITPQTCCSNSPVKVHHLIEREGWIITIVAKYAALPGSFGLSVLLDCGVAEEGVLQPGCGEAVQSVEAVCGVCSVCPVCHVCPSHVMAASDMQNSDMQKLGVKRSKPVSALWIGSGGQ